MNKDKKVLYLITTLIFALLLFVLFIPNDLINAIASILLVSLTIVVSLVIKKRKSLSINKNQVALVMLLVGFVYLLGFYLTGIYFGFYKDYPSLSWLSLLNFILPYSAIIISIEIIRSILLMQDDKLVSVLTFLSCIIVDLIIYANFRTINTFNGFMDLVGVSLLPAISFNLLYSYLAKRFGFRANVGIRLMITLYPYLIPIIPNTPKFLIAIVKLFIPLIIYSFIKSLYDKERMFVKSRPKILSYVGVSALVVVMASIVMLISCQFRYGIIVIGSSSMTGELNKGDAVIYERYDDQIVQKGQIIVFKKDNVLVVHRIVEIENINGQLRYYTKGDANEQNDIGYIISSDIVGITHFKISYVGYPTLWIKDVFNY